MDEEHQPTLVRDRVVCTCGDFNCASLDALASKRIREILGQDQNIELGED